MNLDRTQALLVYTFLFAHLNSEKTEQMFDGESYSSLKDLQDQLRDFLVGGDVNYSRYEEESDDSAEDHCDACESCDSCDDDTEGENEDNNEDDEDEDEVSQPDADDFLTTGLLNDLSSVLVTSPTGSKITLEFEDIDEDDIVDVLLDEGSVIIESVNRLKVSGKTIEVFDGEEWHAFLMEKKLPKSWSKKIKNDVVYGFKKEEGE